MIKVQWLCTTVHFSHNRIVDLIIIPSYVWFLTWKYRWSTSSLPQNSLESFKVSQKMHTRGVTHKLLRIMFMFCETYYGRNHEGDPLQNDDMIHYCCIYGDIWFISHTVWLCHVPFRSWILHQDSFRNAAVSNLKGIQDNEKSCWNSVWNFQMYWKYLLDI